jgi:chaperonin cofactor prefoldin
LTGREVNYSFNHVYEEIDTLEDQMNLRFDRLESQIDRLATRVEERFNRLERKFDLAIETSLTRAKKLGGD